MEEDKLINDIYPKNDNNNKKEEIKKILKNIKDSDNSKDKFMNILKLTKHINDLKESDKINVLKSIDVEFLCLLLRSQNEFKLFTLRLINSLIGSSTCVYLKACFPFINSIIVSYSCYVKNWSNRLKKDVQICNKENKKGINKNASIENNWEQKEKGFSIYDNKYNTCAGDNKYECDDKHLDDDNYISCDQDELKDINIIYNECITFFLKTQAFLKEEEIFNNFYFNSENNDLDVDVEMYFFNKRLKKKYNEEKDNVINNEEDVEENNFIVNKKKGNHDTKNKCNLNDINNINPKRYFDNEKNSSNNIYDDNTSNTDMSILDDDKEQDFYFSNEKICLINLIFTILKENINLKELQNKKNNNKKGNNNDINVDNMNNKDNINSIYKKKCIDIAKYNIFLLNEQCIYISLHFLNNIILKLNDNKYVKEYFHLLNRLAENYNEPKLRITVMNCLTNLNIYIKKKNIENILDEKNIYKFYANIIYYFSEIKDEKEKEILYRLYSTIYSCLHFIYVNYDSIDILKTPLSYMSVELYLFFEDVMKYVSKKEFNNYIFYNKYFKQMIHMICINVEHILKFLSEHYSWYYEKDEIKNDDKGNDISSLYVVENPNIMIEKKKLIKNENTRENINDKNNNNILYVNPTDKICKKTIIELDLNNMYGVILKIKKIMDILLEFFKDIKDIFKLQDEEKQKDLIKFKNEFNKEINVLIKLFCNYLIYENVHYIDDFINLLEFFSIIINEDNFFYLLIVKYIDPNRYFNNKIFLSKLLLYIFNLNMKNIIQIKILFHLYHKCTFNILNYLEIKEPKDISNFSSFIQNNTHNYSFIQILNISIDKLNNLNFIYILCQDEYQIKMNNNSKQNIKNLLLFHIHFFFYYYFSILQKHNFDIINEQKKNKFDLYKENYYNISNNSIKKNTQQFFLSLKILFAISAFLFMRFDSYVITNNLKKSEILFIQDCLILSLLNLKFLNEHESKDNELSEMKKKKKKYFCQVLKLTYFIMYYHPYFISLFIFRWKQIKDQDNNNVFFDVNKIKLKEEHLSICKLLNNFISNYV
ncbi:conserved Plasmodium protein, unknown function [Plasmodium sp. DRC-Itaito]|nr:conserved Plasmodium protein, unknown function [Plasmodium sp. DRC-Itaito]